MNLLAFCWLSLLSLSVSAEKAKDLPYSIKGGKEFVYCSDTPISTYVLLVQKGSPKFLYLTDKLPDGKRGTPFLTVENPKIGAPRMGKIPEPKEICLVLAADGDLDGVMEIHFKPGTAAKDEKVTETNKKSAKSSPNEKVTETKSKSSPSQKKESKKSDNNDKKEAKSKGSKGAKKKSEKKESKKTGKKEAKKGEKKAEKKASKKEDGYGDGMKDDKKEAKKGGKKAEKKASKKEAKKGEKKAEKKPSKKEDGYDDGMKDDEEEGGKVEAKVDKNDRGKAKSKGAQVKKGEIGSNKEAPGKAKPCPIKFDMDTLFSLNATQVGYICAPSSSYRENFTIFVSAGDNLKLTMVKIGEVNDALKSKKPLSCEVKVGKCSNEKWKNACNIVAGCETNKGKKDDDDLVRRSLERRDDDDDGDGGDDDDDGDDDDGGSKKGQAGGKDVATKGSEEHWCVIARNENPEAIYIRALLRTWTSKGVGAPTGKGSGDDLESQFHDKFKEIYKKYTGGGLQRRNYDEEEKPKTFPKALPQIYQSQVEYVIMKNTCHVVCSPSFSYRSVFSVYPDQGSKLKLTVIGADDAKNEHGVGKCTDEPWKGNCTVVVGCAHNDAAKKATKEEYLLKRRGLEGNRATLVKAMIADAAKCKGVKENRWCLRLKNDNDEPVRVFVRFTTWSSEGSTCPLKGTEMMEKDAPAISSGADSAPPDMKDFPDFLAKEFKNFLMKEVNDGDDDDN